jgi:diguanylate cyclase (GGDEF)-like protein
MHVDLFTLYLIAIGTLVVSSAMTLWEHRSHPRRSRELRTLAAGYAILALGCAFATVRAKFGVAGSAFSNLVIMAGYLLVMQGVAALRGQRRVATSAGVLAVLALAWCIAGERGHAFMWYYATAFPIALVSGLTAFELLRSAALKGLHARRIGMIVFGVHAFFYAFRCFVLPALIAWKGDAILPFFSKLTMYEGVLYSVAMPMTLLKLVREETHGQLLRESQTDYLTGLGNRRWFFEEGARIARDDRASRFVSVLAFDIDRFKSINDRYGHEAGDEVLKSFAVTARGVLGRDVVLARIGGEEFAAVLLDYDRFRATRIAERFVEQFARTTCIAADGVKIRATVSAGVAQGERGAATLADLLARADHALYEAKARGGSRVEQASEPPHPALAATNADCETHATDAV